MIRMRRVGRCNRCGECCRTGDPFAPRVPKDARQRPCTYYRERDGMGVCLARDMPEGTRARRYYEIACRMYPENPRQREFFPDCGFQFESDDGG